MEKERLEVTLSASEGVVFGGEHVRLRTRGNFGEKRVPYIVGEL